MEELAVISQQDEEASVFKPGDVISTKHSNLDCVNGVFHCLIGNSELSTLRAYKEAIFKAVKIAN